MKKVDPLEGTFAAIGRAVCAYQAFESVVVLGVELVRIGRTVRQGVATPNQTMNRNRFRVATKSLLKELAHHEDIDPTLHTRIDNLVDRRHTLVHGWVSESGWPSTVRRDKSEEVRRFAQQIERDSNTLRYMLLMFILRHGVNDPTARRPVIEARAVLARLFHDAHLEDGS